MGFGKVGSDFLGVYNNPKPTKKSSLLSRKKDMGEGIKNKNARAMRREGSRLVWGGAEKKIPRSGLF